MHPVVPLIPGTQVAEHRILAVIGSGSFGITYLAMAPASGALVALKEFVPLWYARRAADAVRVEPIDDRWREAFEEGIERFLEEAALLAPIEHPNIVRVERAVQANGTAYMVMAHVVGGTLADRLRAMTRLPGEAFVRGVHDGVRAAVQALHDRDIVHRDIRALDAALNCEVVDLPLSLAAWSRWTAGAAPGSHDAPERKLPAEAEDRPPYRYITSVPSRTLVHPHWPQPGELTVDLPPLPLRPDNLT
jgi:serine/threonine protein kinase